MAWTFFPSTCTLSVRLPSWSYHNHFFITTIVSFSPAITERQDAEERHVFFYIALQDPRLPEEAERQCSGCSAHGSTSWGSATCCRSRLCRPPDTPLLQKGLADGRNYRCSFEMARIPANRQKGIRTQRDLPKLRIRIFP
jgi:hypothetical protein